MKTVLTGVKPTGIPHIGNYLGAIKPAIEMSNDDNYDRALYFIADYHALTSVRDSKKFHEDVYNVAATWLALGLDPKRAIFFKQSDVKEVFELSWMLSCMTPKGDMNRAHSYKDCVAKNTDAGKDPDQGVNVGLFSYPILMAADILLYDTNFVPVGKDQIQHVEIARSIAGRCNEYYGKDTLVEPMEVIGKESSYIPGLDGRKMSKSYDNTILIFSTEKKLKKTINKITTDSSAPEDPKDPNNCQIMTLYRLFANKEQVSALEKRYREGIGWGHAKAELFEVINDHLKEAREKFFYYMENKHLIDEILEDGANRARQIAQKTMQRVRSNITNF
ncbi:MAG: tryptophan--tRNA ligase [Bacteriovoracaceae bacterium]|jgi:tryptophanyl-tRNA synthetase|nr:tryptophan--tRNA ligase [Bacteriovoracaceae bacterium]